MIFAASLALVAGVIAVRGPSRVPAESVALAAAGGALAARAGEAAWFSHIIGGVRAPIAIPTEPGPGFVQGRFEGFYNTWLLPDYYLTQPVSLLLLGVAACLAIAAFGARTSPADRGRVLAAGGRRRVLRSRRPRRRPDDAGPRPAHRLSRADDGHRGHAPSALPLDPDAGSAAATSGLFALGVIATEYPSGGTGEWGGRYFALALPVIVPVVLLALLRQSEVLERSVRRGAVVALAVCSVASTTMALCSIRRVAPVATALPRQRRAGSARSRARVAPSSPPGRLPPPGLADLRPVALALGPHG